MNEIIAINTDITTLKTNVSALNTEKKRYEANITTILEESQKILKTPHLQEELKKEKEILSALDAQQKLKQQNQKNENEQAALVVIQNTINRGTKNNNVLADDIYTEFKKDSVNNNNNRIHQKNNAVTKKDAISL